MRFQDLDILLSSVDVTDVAKRLGLTVERRGTSTLALCPFHSDTRPSLVLYPRAAQTPSHFHCFSCNAHGFAVDLVKKVRGVDFVAAVEWLGGTSSGMSGARAIRSIANKAPLDLAFAFATKIFDSAHDDAKFAQWCEGRGFSVDFLLSRGLRWIPAGSPIVSALEHETFAGQQILSDGLVEAGLILRLRPSANGSRQASLSFKAQYRDYFQDGRIVIPIRSRKGRLVGFGGRYCPPSSNDNGTEGRVPKYLLTPGLRKSELLYNADAVDRDGSLGDAPDSPPLYVVEGFFDSLRLASLGLASVAVMGTSISDDQREDLINILLAPQDRREHAARLRIFFDTDAAGFEGVNRAARQLIGEPGLELEWVGLGDADAPLGKDPDEVLASLERVQVIDFLESHSIPAVGAFIAAGVGFKNATPLHDDHSWNDLAPYLRERALMQASRTMRSVRGDGVRWSDRLGGLVGTQGTWLKDLVEMIDGRATRNRVSARRHIGEAFLSDKDARMNHARMLAEHGARRGELPCDDENWRALDRNSQLFNAIASRRLEGRWNQTSPYDAVSLPRKLTAEPSVLGDPRVKVMPHPADLQMQQFLMNELLTERHDFSHAGARTFSDCIPAVRWFSSAGEHRLTGFPGDEVSAEGAGSSDEEPILSFAYQIDMDVLDGRKPPSDQGMYRPYIECWREFMASISRQASAIGGRVHVLRLDVKRYYDNVQRYVVRDRLLRSIEDALSISGTSALTEMFSDETAIDSAVAERVVDFLCGGLFDYEYFDSSTNETQRSHEVRGIPQGPVVSAWIGTIAMFPVDAEARRFMQSPEGVRSDNYRPRVGYARYVDDIIILADSEDRILAMRDAVSKAAAALDLTLVRKGDQVAPGDVDSVMGQLNTGRALAPSSPVWEPPMIGDGETGWAIGQDDLAAMDRQMALHVLRHPDLLAEVGSVEEKVRNAMRAPDLRPSDLGKCARAVWWSVAQEIDAWSDGPWDRVLAEFISRWCNLTGEYEWGIEFSRLGYDLLFAVEGLDMLFDSGEAVEKGRSNEWVASHRRSLNSLAVRVLAAERLVVPDSTNLNAAHISRRAKKVQWKALQRKPGFTGALPIEQHQSRNLTITDWLCQAAAILRRHSAMTGALDPLKTIQDYRSAGGNGGDDYFQLCALLKTPGRADDGAAEDAISQALTFVVANTRRNARWAILKTYMSLFRDAQPSGELVILPPFPVGTSGLTGFRVAEAGIRFEAFRDTAVSAPAGRAPGAVRNGDRGWMGAELRLDWEEPVELVPGVFRFRGRDTLPLTFDRVHSEDKSRRAYQFFWAMRAVQCQDVEMGTERLIVRDYLASGIEPNEPSSSVEKSWYLISEPVPSRQLGVNAWISDGFGGLRSVSVPGGELAAIWRLGYAVSDALGIVLDRPGDQTIADEADTPVEDIQEIEAFVVRQQLAKIRGKWLSEAQVRDRIVDGIPSTVLRAISLLGQFDPDATVAQKVYSVFKIETESRSMALRLKQLAPIDLRDKLHLVPTLCLHRVPLRVLEYLTLPFPVSEVGLRSDFSFLLSLSRGLREVPQEVADGEAASGLQSMVHVSSVLSAACAGLRGVVASAWGLARFLQPISERLPLPSHWDQPDAIFQDAQRDYESVRRSLSLDDWSSLNEAGPWQWLLALIGILDRVSPQALSKEGHSPIKEVYSGLKFWMSSPVADEELAWPFDGLPSYDERMWDGLLEAVRAAVIFVDGALGIDVTRSVGDVFRRQKGTGEFTDADGRLWTLGYLQYTNAGSSDSVSRADVRGLRRPMWSEARARADGSLLSVHTIDDKLGQWATISAAGSWRVDSSLVNAVLDTRVTQRAEGVADLADSISDGADEADSFQVGVTDVRPPGDRPTDSEERANFSMELSANDVEETAGVSPREGDVVTDVDTADFIRAIRESRAASWTARGASSSNARMRIGFLQLRIDESYSHPIAEVGIRGLHLNERDRATLRGALLKDSTFHFADQAAVRGDEHLWPVSEASLVESWPEHRRRRILKSALDACRRLDVSLLVLPEVSVRRETVDWLEGQLGSNYPGLAILAGTYRHFGDAIVDKAASDEALRLAPLMSPATLLWRPNETLYRSFFPGVTATSETFRFWRGKKYRAVAANEFFRPDWRELKPLFSIDKVLDQLLAKHASLNIGDADLRTLVSALVEECPPLRYCMELICSELFLLTSPANISPLKDEMASLFRRFSGPMESAESVVLADIHALGQSLSVSQNLARPRRSILIVPAATARSNDYWHAGQASVLASGTATVFCNAAKSSFSCGGSCFIGIDSATKTHPDSPGLVEIATPYHGWRTGILKSDGSGALSELDQALVIADVDPVHVVAGKPRPQLLPEPMTLVAYLPIVELWNRAQTTSELYSQLIEGAAPQIGADENAIATRGALEGIGASLGQGAPKESGTFWAAFRALREDGIKGQIDGKRLDDFGRYFSNPKAIRERLLAWHRDREQQPHRGAGAQQLAPAWADFLDVDLTLEPKQPIPLVSVPPWRGAN